MRAYPHNDKDMYLARVRAHRAADELVRGIGWESNGRQRGCAVGCTVHCYDHGRYPQLLGIPVVLASLEDWLFERLDNNCWLEWPEEFLDAIAPGADLSGVWPAWVIRLLDRCRARIGGSQTWAVECRTATVAVRDLFASRAAAGDAGAAEAASRAAAGDAGDAEAASRAAAWSAWAAARADAGAAEAASRAAAGDAGAAEAASRAAAEAAAWAAEAAAWAAEAASRDAGDAAWSAAWAAWAAAGDAEIKQQAVDLLELLRQQGGLQHS